MVFYREGGVGGDEIRFVEVEKGVVSIEDDLNIFLG